jgi:pyruvate dehydrogenase E2 component (dihydrolipoamide acetyltransferase)
MTPVEVPKVGNTVEECIIGEWRKHKGDQVAAGEVIAEIETDKTTFEITAPVSGTILEVFVTQGSFVPVFTRMCVIGEPGESGEASSPAADADRVTASAPTAAAVAVPAVASVAVPTAPPESAYLSPRAKHFAAEHNFQPTSLTGSGPGGRVLEEDVRRAYLATLSAERISSVRDRIARRMRESLSTTAQYTMHASAGAARLLSLRAKCKASAGLSDITIGDMVLFCAVRALVKVPALNVEYIDGRICQHAEINIGFACDTERGLLVPVVKECQALTLAALSDRVHQLAEQAVQGTIAADDLRGATFTVSNLGNLGIEFFTPILNPPQVAILGVNAIQLKAVRKEGGIEFIDSIGLSLTCDHQAIDGAPGARFLKILARTIEEVDSL